MTAIDYCARCRAIVDGRHDYNCASECPRCNKDICDACEEDHWNSEECG